MPLRAALRMSDSIEIMTHDTTIKIWRTRAQAFVGELLQIDFRKNPRILALLPVIWALAGCVPKDIPSLEVDDFEPIGDLLDGDDYNSADSGADPRDQFDLGAVGDLLGLPAGPFMGYCSDMEGPDLVSSLSTLAIDSTLPAECTNVASLNMLGMETPNEDGELSVRLQTDCRVYFHNLLFIPPDLWPDYVNGLDRTLRFDPSGLQKGTNADGQTVFQIEYFITIVFNDIEIPIAGTITLVLSSDDGLEAFTQITTNLSPPEESLQVWMHAPDLKQYESALMAAYSIGEGDGYMTGMTNFNWACQWWKTGEIPASP